jgi:hypothetical protein
MITWAALIAPLVFLLFVIVLPFLFIMSMIWIATRSSGQPVQLNRGRGPASRSSQLAQEIHGMLTDLEKRVEELETILLKHLDS